MNLFDEEADMQIVEELAGYEQEVDRIRAGAVSPASLKVYRAASRRFILWLFEKRPDLLAANTLQDLSIQQLQKNYI
jgi:hypothetical protein